MHRLLPSLLLSLIGLTALATVAPVGSALADEELAAKYACVTCHEIDFKKVGPAYEEVAKKYRGADAKTIDTLVKHVKEGSTGIWGSMIMPPQAQISEQDARVLVKWVLSLDAK